jgi:tetratricopeptide (TPR) repeat protein
VFAREVDSDETMKTALEGALLYKINGEKGEGPDLAKKYNVRGWPTFLAVNGDGEVTDRWVGYDGAEKWSATVDAAKADRRTITEKKAAYETEPTLALALALANDASTDFDFKTAVDYLKIARDMDADNAGTYTEQIIMSMAYGVRGGAFTFDQVDAEAQAALASGGATPEQVLQLALMMKGMSAQMGMPEKAVPYIEAAMKATEGTEDEDLLKGREYLAVDYALMVEKDVEKAYKLKLESMEEGWEEDSNALNNFAWWCFENDTHLEQALEWAIKGTEVAGSDGERANVLDTAAELCNALGNCDDAITKIKKAIELDPENAYFKDQLAKFEKAAQEKADAENKG